MQEILVIRFSSLGDLCVLGAALARWSDAPRAAERRITLVTKSAFAPLMRRMRGIDEVIELADSSAGSLIRLAGRLQERRWDRVFDAHGTLRSRLLLAATGLRPDAVLAKDTAARLAFLRWRIRSRALERTLSDRFDALFGLQGGRDSRVPRGSRREADRVAEPPALPTPGVRRDARLGLAPGAQWPSKQWPQEYFADLLEAFRAARDAPVTIFLGPRERSWYAGSRLQEAARSLPAVTVVQDRSLLEVADGLASCSLVVTNDSGLLHVAEAVGTPVVAFFGPTVREFGYFPRLPGSEVLEIPLECRPCSRNGKRACHRGDLACLRRIEPEQALRHVLNSFGRSAHEESR